MKLPVAVLGNGLATEARKLEGLSPALRKRRFSSRVRWDAKKKRNSWDRKIQMHQSLPAFPLRAHPVRVPSRFQGWAGR